MNRQRVGIIGYGRFGRLWTGVLAPHHDVLVYDVVQPETPRARPLPDVMEHSEAIFLCVPINRFEAVVGELKPHLKPGTTVFDVCSVKVHPSKVLLAELGSAPRTTLIATHPMFGPDSAAQGVQGLPMVLWLLSGEDAVYREWTRFFQELGIHTVEISPDQHDRLAAYSQGVTHYVGRVLRELDVQPTAIDTQGFKMLRALIDQTCNDSWELFRDLQIYNPYTREMRQRLEHALVRVSHALEP